MADQSASLIITWQRRCAGAGARHRGDRFLVAASPRRQPGRLTQHSELTAREIVAESLKVAGEICIYTNQNHVIEELTLVVDSPAL